MSDHGANDVHVEHGQVTHVQQEATPKPTGVEACDGRNFGAIRDFNHSLGFTS